MKFVHRVFGKLSAALRFVRGYSQHLPLAFEMVFALHCRVTLLQGTLRNSSHAIHLLYVGRRRNFDYLRRLVFEECRELQVIDSTLLTYRKHLASLQATADVTVVDIGWPYHGAFNRNGDYLVIPDWVNMSLDLPERWEDVVRKFRRTVRHNDLPLIEKSGYRCELTRDPDAIGLFYDSMYVPFVGHKNETDAVIASRRHVLKRATQGHLLNVLCGNEIVAAGVLYAQGDVLYFLWMGIPAARLSSPAKGAISALYFFGIRHAFDSGCKTVDFTGTRPFLTDGAVRFKRKWGAEVEDTFSPSSILIRLTRGSTAALAFCERFPVLARGRKGLQALFVTNDVADKALCAKLHKEHMCQGVRQMTLLNVSDETATTSLPDTIGQCQCTVMEVSLDHLADRYAGRDAE